MFTFSRTKLATVFAGLALVAAGNVAAADMKIDGVVEFVDYQTNSITVTADKTGEVFTYRFTGRPKIDVNGRKLYDMSIVEVGQNVTLKLSVPNKQKSASLTR